MTNIQQILTDLDEKTLILTVNQRLAARLETQFTNIQKMQNKQAWFSPNIFPLSAWLSTLWQENVDSDALLLSDLQENLLWQKIVSHQTQDAFFSQQSASLIQQAWRMLQQWEVLPSEVELFKNPEVEFFLSCVAAFSSFLKERNWITSAQLPHQLQIYFSEIFPKTNIQKIILVGFDDIAPVVQKFLHLWREKISVFEYLPQQKQSQVQRAEFDNIEDEIFAMANWAKQQLNTNAGNLEIACIVPNLTQIRKMVRRIFTETFMPLHILPGMSSVEALPFSISSGDSLNTFNVIQTAIKALNLAPELLATEALLDVLRSPYIFSDHLMRVFIGYVDQKFREAELWHVSYEVICDVLQDWSRQFSLNPKCIHPIRLFFSEQLKAPIYQAPSAWFKTFNNELRYLGWPGQRSFNSLEYQLLMSWKDLYSDFVQMNVLVEKQTRAEALKILEKLVKETIFQTKSFDTPIKILGILEASGSLFDKLWLMGLDDENWPPPANPNPFIPFSIQKKYNMPHATATKEFLYIEKVQERLLKSSKEIWLSHSQQDGDKILHASQLIEKIPLVNSCVFFERKEKNSLAKQILKRSDMEKIIDIQAPKISMDEILQGGHRILRQQALCPFQAFATVRLNARKLYSEHIGLSTKERGIFLHQVLEQLWKSLKNQDALCQLSEIELKELISSIIDQVIFSEKHSLSSFIKIEKKRLQSLVYQWLEFEKTRPYFSVIAQEKTFQVNIGKIPVKLRIDRVDELADKSVMLIDYKTGKNNSYQYWLGDRLIDPQLPIYCAYSEFSSSAISYAEVRMNKMNFTGLLDQQKINQKFSKIKLISELNGEFSELTWSDMVLKWKDKLQQLSMDFCDGYAAVDPYQTNTCNTCSLQSLCRIRK